ncbi:MAG TPA: hypothetical protein VJ824_04630 [Bacillota bacterium]|nr:hypothetical protein [Bacillota bacterium]
MKSLYCIDCGRELSEYLSETLHYCNICETRLSKRSFLYDKLTIELEKIYPRIVELKV